MAPNPTHLPPFLLMLSSSSCSCSLPHPSHALSFILLMLSSSSCSKADFKELIHLLLSPSTSLEKHLPVETPTHILVNSTSIRTPQNPNPHLYPSPSLSLPFCCRPSVPLLSLSPPPFPSPPPLALACPYLDNFGAYLPSVHT